MREIFKAGTVNGRPLVHAQGPKGQRDRSLCGKPLFRLLPGSIEFDAHDGHCVSCTRMVQRRERSAGGTWVNDEDWVQRTREAMGAT